MRKFFSMLAAVLFAGSMMAADPVIPDTISSAQAREAALSGMTDEVVVRGYVTEIVSAWNAQYKNVSFWMADTQDGGRVFEAYRVACETEAEAPGVGDLVWVKGELTKYNTTPETKQGGTFGIIEKSQIVPQNLGEKTIAEFLALKSVVDTCVLTGVVDSIINTTYGNLYLSDTTAQVYVYGVLTADGQSKKFAELGVEAGDTLTVMALYNEYNNKPQVKNAIFVSVKKAQVVEHHYTVAGAPADLFGTVWDPSNEENDMEFLANQAYMWIKDSVALRAGTVEFKVCEDHAWTNAWPEQNYKLAIPEDGYYTILIAFNLAAVPDSVVEAKAIKVGEIEPIVEEIYFNKACAKDSLAADAVLGSDIFNLTITDPENKMEIDQNSAAFGMNSVEAIYSYRLKSGGKSTSTKNYMTLSIPEEGLLSIAVRNANKDDSTRTLVLVQGEDTLYNQIVKDADAQQFIIDDTITMTCYPYVVVPVKAGEVKVTYPVGALNFYAFAFTNKTEEPVAETHYTVAGAPAALFGTEWDPSNEANDLVPYVLSSYKWSKDSVALPAGEVEFKVCKNHTWDEAYPAQNYKLAIPENGLYDVQILFFPEAAVDSMIIAVATKVGEAEFGSAKYYVAGSMNGWKADDAYELVESFVQEGEYLGEFEFKNGDAFKVIKDNGAGSYTWYPDGMGNDYKITQDGTYMVYFRPEGNVEGWYEGYFHVHMQNDPVIKDTVYITMIEDLEFTNAIEEEGWWEIYGQNEEYAFSLSNVFTTELAGHYTVDDMEYDYTFVTPLNSTDTIHFVEGDLNVLGSETDTIINFIGSFIGTDSICYSFALAYNTAYVNPFKHDEKTAEFVYDFEEYIVDTTYASAGIFKVNAVTDSTYITLLMIMPQGKTALTAGEYSVAYGDNITFQTVQGGEWNEEYGIFVGSVAATLIEYEGKLYFGKVWYVNSGKVTVDEKLNITVDALNSKGKAIKATLKAPKDQAVENVETGIKARKTLKNDQIIIEKNGAEYNVLGTRIR